MHQLLEYISIAFIAFFFAYMFRLFQKENRLMRQTKQETEKGLDLTEREVQLILKRIKKRNP